MNPTLVTGPLVEPLTLTEAKAHLKIDHADEDSYISNLITAARVFAEDYTRSFMVEQTLKWTLDRWPGYGGRYEETLPLISNYGKNRFIEVPRGPLISVETITTFDDKDTGTVWGVGNYYVSAPQNRIYRRTGATWPNPGRAGGGIEILYKAGFGASAANIPKSLKQGLLQLVAHFYSNREAAGAVGFSHVPFSVREQLSLFKGISL